MATSIGNYICSYNNPDTFHILSLTLPVIYDFNSNTNAAAVKLFYFTFMNIIRPFTGVLNLDINLISNL